MSAPTKIALESTDGKVPFGVLARQVLALDAAIEWVTFEEPGREPRWAWRDAETGTIRAGTTTKSAHVVDPLLLLVAGGCDELDAAPTITNPHRLLFVVVAYADIVQIVARFGADAYVSVAASPSIDAHALGTRLISLLESCTRCSSWVDGCRMRAPGPPSLGEPREAVRR